MPRFIAIFLLGWLSICFGYEKIIQIESGRFCCTKHYDPCELGCIAEGFCAAECTPQPVCLEGCLKAHCTKDTKKCTASRRGASVGKGSIRHDGRLTGPGTVVYEIFNRSTDIHSLTVIGIVYGNNKLTGQRVVVNRTLDAQVLPTASARLRLEVSEDNFRNWSKKYGKLTVAISLASEKNAGQWKFKNLLTEADKNAQQDGKFLVRGAFHYIGKKK